MKRIITFSVVIAISIMNTMAQPGSLDMTFGTGGKVVTAFADTAYGQSIALQQDDKIIVAGDAVTNGIRTFALVRYNADGSLDGAFGSGGKVSTPYHNNYTGSVAIQPDGKILLCGSSDDLVFDPVMSVYHPRFTLLRYNTDGTLDVPFGTNGIVRTAFSSTSFDYAHSLVVQPDLKILVAGGSSHNFAFARYYPDGSPDSTFNYNGRLKVDFGFEDEAMSVALQSDGKFIASGYSGNYPDFDFGLVRFKSNGVIDSTFGTNGLVRIDFASSSDMPYSMLIQTDGKYVVAGTTANKFAIARFTVNGILDNTFNSDGIDTLSFQYGGNCFSAYLQSDGKILMAGTSNQNFILLRYNSDGTLDNAFGTNGIYTTDFSMGNDQAMSVIMQQDDKILLAGYTKTASIFQFALARYVSGLEGISELAGLNNNMFVYPNPFTSEVVVDLNNVGFKNAVIKIYDVIGEKVFEKILNSSNVDSQKITLDLRSLKAGIYSIEFSSDTCIKSCKIVKNY